MKYIMRRLRRRLLRAEISDIFDRVYFVADPRKTTEMFVSRITHDRDGISVELRTMKEHYTRP